MRSGDGTEADRRETMRGKKTIPFSLNRRNLGKLRSTAIAVPKASLFELPERVLQFGTDPLLRALPAWCIQKANSQGAFNGRILAVTSDQSEEAARFSRQDALFTICERNSNGKQHTAALSINAAISRVLNESLHWDQILRSVSNPDMQIVIAHTSGTEVVLKKDNVHLQPPKLFPGKLLAVLYHRFRSFNGDPNSGMVIIHVSEGPGEGKRLDAIVLELAHQNGLEIAFLDWLEACNHFCNSMADRLVLGSVTQQQRQELERITGYKDELLLITEAYKSWRIETASKKVQKILSFSQAGTGVVLSPQLSSFGNMKLIRG